MNSTRYKSLLRFNIKSSYCITAKSLFGPKALRFQNIDKHWRRGVGGLAACIQAKILVFDNG